ncbi:MAG TPA: methyltransferase domain-containing protein [Thermoanaerobaculia bacterium]|nr:methyltransferase domain-containing protein [Thermoanaerobaculia bacterium]
MPYLSEKSIVYAPSCFAFHEGDVDFFLDAAAPYWVAVDERGARILQQIDGRKSFGNLVSWYGATGGLEAGKAWLHVHDFLQSCLRAGFLSETPIEHPRYEGRRLYAAPNGLHELWLHTNNSCNLACTHCLVNSGPGLTPGLPGPELRRVVVEALGMGVERFYMTGGEPFLRPDLEDIARLITEESGRDLILLTNATLLRGPRGRGLASLSRERVKFQVSLDGARPESNDPIRGAGTFQKALDGLRFLADLGFEVSLTTVVTRQNLRELPDLTGHAAKSGATSQHLMWSHRRGRARESDNGFFPETAEILVALARTADRARELGIALDNLEAARRRVNGQPGVKYDLGNAGWDSLCIYADGTVYPSAALADHHPLACGRVTERPLSAIFESSPVLERFRRATLVDRAQALADPFRFLTGGGDLEHAYMFSAPEGEDAEGDLTAPDPYYPIAVALVRRAMREVAEEKRAAQNRRSGYDPPALYHAMGDGSIACGLADGAAAEMPVLTLHSNCVLSFDVDKPRALVRQYYARAAETPQAELCCPTKFDDAEIGHIPRAVIDRFYGCGSPVSRAGLKEGEAFLDLGSGAGIDVFIAAKKVGPSGLALGVDMTDPMLAVANENRPIVAANLGYDVVQFRRGFLESIPAETKGFDVVTSNCVVNLSPDKSKVFSEIWRVLKDHGRVIIADIVSDGEVPPHLKTNPELWGECIVGALTAEGFVAGLEKAGFYGVEIVETSYWKSIEGYRFYSMTVRGHKFEKTAGCVCRGQRATYLGPGKAFVDEEGHTFPRGLAVEVCTDTAAKLAHPPYAGAFNVIEPEGDGSFQGGGSRGPDEGCARGCC